MTTFRRSRLWLATVAIGFAGIFAFNKRLDDFIVTIFYIPTAIGIAMLTFVVKKHYRCPSCEGVVRTNKGVLLNPRECPHCGTRLSK